MYDAFVTGASGFIGSHLIEYLLKKNKTIAASYRKSETTLNINDTVKIIRWDITEEMSSIPSCKVWYHLASITDIGICNKNPELAYKINTNSINNVIRHAEISNCETFVLVSTLGVYGNPNYFPTDENHPTKPIEVYSLSKAKAEKELQRIKSNCKKHVIVRLFNTFGPRQSSHMLIPSLLNQIHNNSLIEVNNISFTRDFLYVSDIVRGIFLAGKKGKHNEIYNLGSGLETSIEELINAIKLATDKNFQVVNKNLRSLTYNIVNRSQADIKKAALVLTWEPRISLKNGIKMTADYLNK
tara:strand:- start:1412 stop:2308 length:897 start_codon:yes stop_codon:yes gene_type:complete